MLSRAMSQVGTVGRARGDVTPRVREYLQAAGVNSGSQPPYWGGAFLAWCAISDGLIPPVGANEAEAWAAWGDPISEPVAGSVVVLTGGATVKHVGVVVRRHAGKLYVIGGDQDGSVNIRRCDETKVIAARRPPNAQLAAPRAEPQTVDVVVTVAGTAQPAAAVAEPEPIRILPDVMPTPEDVEAYRRSVITAIAAAAEARPDDQRAVLALASIAADATSAATIDGVQAAHQRALTQIEGAA